jgi:hypothetical protein
MEEEISGTLRTIHILPTVCTSTLNIHMTIYYRVCELESQVLQEATLKDIGNLNISSTLDLGCFTSLSYDIYTKYLSISTDSGDVLVIDMNTAQEISRFKADVCGCSQIKFQRSDALISIGRSLTSQLKVWDIRSSTTTSIVKSVKTFHHAPGTGMKRTFQNVHQNNIVTPFSYSCLCPHTAQDRVLCGTTCGYIFEWDLRLGAVEGFNPHGAKVTALQYDTSGYGNTSKFFSTSADGTLKHTDTTLYQSTTLISETSATVCSLDYDVDSNRLLACSNLGSLWSIKAE